MKKRDGASVHCVVLVWQFFDNNFTCRWIGRQDPTEWPPRYPDLTPLDFLYGYGWNENSIEDNSRKEIIRCFRLLTPEILQNVRKETEARLYHCLQVNGAQFEHWFRCHSVKFVLVSVLKTPVYPYTCLNRKLTIFVARLFELFCVANSNRSVLKMHATMKWKSFVPCILLKQGIIKIEMGALSVPQTGFQLG